MEGCILSGVILDRLTVPTRPVDPRCPGRAAQKAFEATACPHVYECQLISGHFDYSLRMRCRDMEHYRVLSESWMNDDALHIDKLVAHPELASVKSMAPQP